MDIAAELEAIVAEARKRVGALHKKYGIGVWEHVQIELMELRLVDAVTILREASSPEQANIEAEEEPAAPRH